MELNKNMFLIASACALVLMAGCRQKKAGFNLSAASSMVKIIEEC